MSLAIVDAREWQKQFDLRTGRKVQEEGPLVGELSAVLKRHPFPGNTIPEVSTWVTDTALDLLARYQARLVFLSYTRTYFSSFFTPLSDSEQDEIIESVFWEVARFILESGFTPVIVGSGDMVPFKGYIELGRLDGFAMSTHWSARYAGLHDPSRSDLKRLQGIPGIERIVHRDEFVTLFKGKPEESAGVPECLLLAEEGRAFKTAGTNLRRSFRVPGRNFLVPYSSPFGAGGSITGLREMIENGLQKERVALIVIEGVGLKGFRWPCEECLNGLEWFYYEPGDAQYLSIATGRHQVFAYPTGFNYSKQDIKVEYPLSGYLTSVPEHTLGMDFAGKSMAVGSRSMLTHMAFGADISIEPFARNLHNLGTMGVIHRQDKGTESD